MTDERHFSLAEAAKQIGATPDERIPGLWHLPGYPELTEGQILALWLKGST